MQAESSGTLRVLRADGTSLPGFPVRTRPLAAVHAGAPAYARVEAPLEPLRTPAIGDVDGDRRAEIVDTAGEHVYAWELDGTPVAGFPVRLNPDFSRPEDRTRENHVKRGFFAAPCLPTSRAARRWRSSPPRWTSTSTPSTARAPPSRAGR